MGRRNTPSLLNAAYRVTFSWDGRARSLEEQVLSPIADSLELNLPLVELESRLRARQSYRHAFRREFGGDPDAPSIARALASYVRTLRVGDSPLDRYRNGEFAALSVRARRGLDLFSGRAGCTTCHGGPLLSDGDFHNTGVAWQGGTFRDDGRASISRNEADRGSFKTPSLRNVALTPPYMHDGSIKTLRDVIDFYAAGGRPNPNLDPFVQPLSLTADEKANLVAFLEALTGKPTSP